MLPSLINAYLHHLYLYDIAFCISFHSMLSEGKQSEMQQLDVENWNRQTLENICTLCVCIIYNVFISVFVYNVW